uniref:Uncharacterized protein n=1 Tax=Ciona savignyi TaxID=51511 RepID=H2YZS5_CIOSA
KKYAKIPVHVVEYHNEVVEVIYRAIGSKHLPLENSALIHFDSHPDLGVPENFDARKIFDKTSLLNAISIENWILPAVFAGHFDSIIWIKPTWSNQLHEGTHKFCVGRDTLSNRICVSSKDSYFLSDCLYKSEDLMVEKKEVTVHVLDINDQRCRQICANVNDHNLNHILSSSLTDLLKSNQSYILDIDLDFFSTKNPFLEMFSPDDLTELFELYKFEPNTEVISITLFLMRLKQLNELQSWIEMMKLGHQSADPRFNILQRIVKNYESKLDRNLDNDDYDIIHGAGLATDEPPLPHHVSTNNEIMNNLNLVEKILRCNLWNPVLVTVARSTIDDYCPNNQVDFIQSEVELLLKSLYGEVDIAHYYDDIPTQ